MLLKSVVRELQALLRSIGPEIPLRAISVRIQSLLISPVHTAVHSLSILVGASSPRIVPETAEGGLLLVTHNLRDDLRAEVVSQVNTERKSNHSRLKYTETQCHDMAFIKRRSLS